VTNYDNWGNLVKRWAKGDQPWPQSLGELKAQCVQANVGIDIPSEVKAIQFIQANEETMVIRLPPKAMVLAGEADLAANPQAGYPMPKFYKDAFNDAEPQIADALLFQAERIGEYCISECI
jgi:hypothetical protein